MATCLIGLGSNLGERAATMERALTLLDTLPDTRLLARSDPQTTRAVGGPPDQADFLNAAAIVETRLLPEAFIGHLQQIERDLQRERHERWGPRTIDLDLLLVDQQVIDAPHVTIPHPRMAFRRFVLQPAVQIAPDWIHPSTQFTLRELFDRLDTKPLRVAIVGDSQRWLSRQVAIDSSLCCVEHLEIVELTSPHNSQLVVWLDDESNRAHRELLEKLLYRPRQFPVLRLRGADRQLALAEFSAAVSAMLPGP